MNDPGGTVVVGNPAPSSPAWWRGAALAGAAGLFAALAPMADVLGWLSLWLATAIIGLVALRRPMLAAPLLAGFAARGAAALVQAYGFSLPGSQLDAVTFERYGWQWAADGFTGAFEHFESGAYLYSWVIALIYGLTDRSALMIQVLNVLFGTLIIRNTYVLAHLVWGEQAARRAAWTTALFPTLILYSALTMREVAVVYPLTLGVLWFVRWRATHRPIWVLGAMAALAVSISFHVVVVGVIASALFLIFLSWGSSLLRGEVFASARVAIGFIVAGGIAMFVLGRGWGNINYLGSMSTEVIRFQQEVAAVDRTAYLQGFFSESLVDFIWQTPIRVVFFLFMPFPWMMRSVLDLIGVIDSLLYMWLFWNILRRSGTIRRSLPARTTLILTMSTILVFGLVVSNYGTAIRHRAKVAPMLAVLAAAVAVTHRGDPAVRVEEAAPVEVGT